MVWRSPPTYEMAGVRSDLAGRAAVILIRSRITTVCGPEHGVRSGSGVPRLSHGVCVCGFVLGLQQHRQYAVLYFLRDLKSYL